MAQAKVESLISFLAALSTYVSATLLANSFQTRTLPVVICFDGVWFFQTTWQKNGTIAARICSNRRCNRRTGHYRSNPLVRASNWDPLCHFFLTVKLSSTFGVDGNGNAITVRNKGQSRQGCFQQSFSYVLAAMIKMKVHVKRCQ